MIDFKAGETTLTATYKAGSLANGKATFVLSEGSKLVDATTYTVSGNGLTFTAENFVAKVAPAYVAGFAKVTTGIPAQESGAKVTFSATNQYGEEIAPPSANTTAKVTVNGLTLTAAEATYTNGVVTINRALAEDDVVVINLKHTDGATPAKTLAEGTFNYTVVKTADVKVTSVKVNPTKTSVPAQEATALNVSVMDQFNNKLTGANGEVRYQVNGSPVTVDGVNSPIKTDANDEIVFESSTPGEYVVEVFSNVDTKVKASTTITVGAATLKGLTVNTSVDKVTTDVAKRFNNEEIVVATVAPNTGAALTPANLKFNVTSSTPGLTADDVTVTADKVTVGTGETAKEVVVIKATSSKAGTFTVTPYVGESLTAEATVPGTPVTFTTAKNPEVASISDITFSAKELKVNSEIKKEIVLKNKHGEVLTKAEADASVTSSNTGVLEVDSDVAIEQGTGDNKDKTYLVLNAKAAGTTQVTVQADDVLKTYTLKFVESTLTTVNAGSNVTGVVAGDRPADFGTPAHNDSAKYNELKYFDQDNQEITLGDGYNVTATVKGPKDSTVQAADLITFGKYVAKKGETAATFTETAQKEATHIQVLPKSGVAEGIYEITVTAKKGDKEVTSKFNIEVGSERALKAITITPATETVALGGTTEFTVNLVDQYGDAFDAGNLTASAPGSAFTFANAGALTQDTDTDGNIVGQYTFKATGEKNGNHVITVSNGLAGDKEIKATTSVTVAPGSELAESIVVKGADVKEGALTKEFKVPTEDHAAAVLTTLSAEGLDAAGKTIALNPTEVQWSTTDTDLIEVDANGVVTLLENAKLDKANTSKDVTVTADFMGKKQTITLTLSNKAALLAPGTLKVANADSQDADKDKEGLQIKLDQEKTSATLDFVGKDQYGETLVPNPTVFATSANAGIASVAVSESNKNQVVITPENLGKTTVRVTSGSDVIVIDVEVSGMKVDNTPLVPAQIAYTASGDITDASDEVTFDAGKFTVPFGVTTFTFKEDGKAVTAVFNAETKKWGFTQAPTTIDTKLDSAKVSKKAVAKVDAVTGVEEKAATSEITFAEVDTAEVVAVTGVEEEAATGVIIYSQVESATNKVKVGDTVLDFDSGDYSDADTLATAITEAGEGVTAVNAEGTITLTADAAGVAGNEIALQINDTPATTLLGGVDKVETVEAVAASTVKVGETTFTFDTDYTTAETLATAITEAGEGVTAVNAEGTITLTADATGVAGNEIALQINDTPATTLLGGVDKVEAVEGVEAVKGEIVLTFSEAVTVADGIILDLDGEKTATVASGNIVVSEDGKTVTLSFDAASDLASATSIEAITGVNGSNDKSVVTTTITITPLS